MNDMSELPEVVTNKHKENTKWYILQVYSGFEDSVVVDLKQKMQRESLDEFVSDIVVPVKEVITIKRGKKVAVKKNFLPGYILINMNLTEEISSLIRSVPKVSGFLGAKKGDHIPKSVSIEEISNILQNIEETADKNNILDSRFAIGESVTIAEGPFATFSGVIEEVDKDKQKLKLSVSIFDRMVPVELDFSQVEKESD